MRSPRQFPETDAQRILARAIELDAAEGPRLSRAELESIARELDVAPEAVDQAIVEAADARARRPGGALTPLRTAWRLTLLSLAGGAAAGASVGFWPRAVLVGAKDGPVLVALGLLGLTALGLIAWNRAREDGWHLQGALLALWAGFGLGLSGVERAPLSDVWGLCAAAWALSAVAAVLVAGVNQLYSPRAPARTGPRNAT